MSAISREEHIKTARDMYFMWIEAEKAVRTGQEYRIGTRFLRRADLGEIRRSIKYWKDELASLEGASRIRVQQAIPRDT